MESLEASGPAANMINESTERCCGKFLGHGSLTSGFQGDLINFV